MADAPSYIHGTDPDEQHRLSLLNEILNDACVRELRLQGGERILDIGSGLGQLTRAMARAAGERGSVLGIERSPEQLAEAQRLARLDGEERLVELRQGEALAPPLRDEEWSSFDLAYTRFVLEHVADPLAVVRSMVAAVRPGGRIVLSDDDHDVLRLWPELPAFTAVWQAYMQTYERRGTDPFVGRRLVSLLHEAGASPLRNSWVFFGGCAGSPIFPAIVGNMTGTLSGARDEILITANQGPEWFDRGIATFTEWSQRPDAAFWFALSWAEGVRPR